MTPLHTQARLCADAHDAAKAIAEESRQPYYHGYIAGATAEHERAQVLVEALEDIAESDCEYETIDYAKTEHSIECKACMAKKVLDSLKAKTKENDNTGAL